MEQPLFNRILLAIDSSASSRGAAVAIAHLAASMKAQVLVIHIWNLEEQRRMDSSNAEGLVDDIVELLQKAGVSASGEVINAADNDVGLAIEEAAAVFGADLVAVGSRGLSDLAGVFAHSVSHGLMADLDCPVLVASGAAVRTRPLRRILLALSQAAESDRLGDLAVAIAKPVDALVLVVHAQVLATSAEGFVYLEAPADAQNVVDGAVQRIQEMGVKVQGRVGTAGLPVADEIAAIAQKWDADLIISGSRRHRDLAALLVGATDHQLIRQSQRPVLIARRPSE